MQVSVEQSGAIERRLTVSVPRAEVDREIDKRLAQKTKQARIRGFRPGKAPRKVVEQHFGAQIANEVVNDTINASYRQALGEQEIVPAALVSIEPKPLADGDDLQFVATVELFPQIPSPTLAGKTIEKPVCEITAEDVERTMQDIRARNAEFTPKDGAAQNGDRLTIDFDGRIAGEPFAGGAAEGHQFALGEGRMLPEFERALLDAVAGDSKQIACKLPTDYPDQIAGKQAMFEVAVKAVERRVLPELDDAFAARLGIAEGGLGKMREEIEISLRRELAERERAVMRERVLQALLDANPIEAPKALVESEIDRTLQSIRERMEAQGMPPGKRGNEREIERAPFTDEARKRVIIGLVTREVLEQNDIQPDPTAVRARIEEMATGYDDGDAVVEWHYAQPQRLAPFEAMVREERMIAHLLETAAVTEKKVSFQELMNPAAASAD
ncbi:MAG: trigger factor [bacterium]